MRSKLLPIALLFLISAPSTLLAQTDRSNMQFYLSARFAGQATVTFNNVGTIPSNNDLGDTTSAMNRVYGDGAVFLDQRFTDDGDKIPEDGRTNRWAFAGDSQVLEDGSGIAFSDFNTDGGGQTVDADAKGAAGLDMEFAIRLADYGKGGFGTTGPINWGVSFGFGFNDLNVKYRESIKATLEATRDVYSLLGSAAPQGPFFSPSAETRTVTNPDGTTSSFPVDTSVLLQNTPYDRTTTITPDGADVDGYWEIDGVALSFRLGPWIRWRPLDRISFRVGAGVSAALLGVTFSYDERAQIGGGRSIQAALEGGTEKITYVGFYGTLDAEFWFTPVTGIFAGVTYQNTSADLSLVVGNRSADLGITSGVGFRIGITTHF